MPNRKRAARSRLAADSGLAKMGTGQRGFLPNDVVNRIIRHTPRFETNSQQSAADARFGARANTLGITGARGADLRDLRHIAAQ